MTPEDAGLPRAPPEDLKGGDPRHNAAALNAAAATATPAPIAISCLYNSAAALLVAGKAATLRDGVQMAAERSPSTSGAALADAGCLSPSATGRGVTAA